LPATSYQLPASSYIDPVVASLAIYLGCASRRLEVGSRKSEAGAGSGKRTASVSRPCFVAACDSIPEIGLLGRRQSGQRGPIVLPRLEKTFTSAVDLTACTAGFLSLSCLCSAPDLAPSTSLVRIWSRRANRRPKSWLPTSAACHRLAMPGNVIRSSSIWSR